MTDQPTSPPPYVPGTTQAAGRSVDEGKARIFPCEGCGADLQFSIDQQRLKCPYCGFEKELHIADGASIQEQDYHAVLARLRELRARREQDKSVEHDEHASDSEEPNELTCTSCGGTVVFVGSLTSSECPYCASPIQRDDVHTAEDRIPVDGVLPFLIPKDSASKNLRDWVTSRWFAPNKFKKRGVQGTLNGVYLPYWTFDTMTANHYTGERGEHYWVTRGTGKNKRRVRRTRWYSASGAFQRFFDDVLVSATSGLPRNLLDSLEPWQLNKCIAFNQEVLAGYLARTYETELDDGLSDAKKRIDSAIAADVRQRIGGDDQRVHQIKTRLDALTFKHLLLPVWLLAYRYNDKPYQVMINASTGEVIGERPYSWVKITLAVLAGLLVAGIGAFLFSRANV